MASLILKRSKISWKEKSSTSCRSYYCNVVSIYGTSPTKYFFIIVNPNPTCVVNLVLLNGKIRLSAQQMTGKIHGNFPDVFSKGNCFPSL